MSEVSGNDPIDDVTPGDIIAVDRGSGEQPYKVVFKDTTDAGYVVTFEDDDGETFQLDLAAGTTVTRWLETFVRRIESPKLVVDPPPYRDNQVFRGPRHLWVDFAEIAD